MDTGEVLEQIRYYITTTQNKNMKNMKNMKNYRKIVWSFNPSIDSEVIQRIAFSFGYDWEDNDSYDALTKIIFSEERMMFDPNTKKISAVHCKYDCTHTRWTSSLPHFMESLKDPPEIIPTVSSPAPDTKSNLNFPVVSFMYHDKIRRVRVTKMYDNHLEGFETSCGGKPYLIESYKKYRIDEMESDVVLISFVQDIPKTIDYEP